MPRLLFGILALLLPAQAQDGNQLYTLYCSACHGADGQGATGGQFPPLAGSPWLAGEPERAARIILHGLHGPLQVQGRAFNLEMPPQGALLDDAAIAAILSYVRSAWGNAHPPVAAEAIAAIRAAHPERKSPWTAEELLRDFPLPLEKSVLRGLISQTYRWEGSSMPDFATLQPINQEEEHDGLLDVADAPLKDLFALSWQGEFHAPVDGTYEFLLDADDGAALFLGGEKVVQVSGTGPLDGSRLQRGEISLAAGPQTFRAEYFEYLGQEGMAASWRLKGEEIWHSLSVTPPTLRPELAPSPILPEPDRPAIYRNFIDGTSPRAIGVGFPAGVNLAYSADRLAPEMVWTGDFIDAGPKWRERGTDPSPPAGQQLVQLSASPAWPEGAHFHGYELDAQGNPTFVIQIGEQWVRDHYEAQAGTLIRRLTLREGPALKLLVSDAHSWQKDAQQLGPLQLEITGAARDFSLGQPFTLMLHPGTTTLTYRWP